MLKLVERSEADAAFAFRVYADSREDEVAEWGWPREQLEPFLQMQFRAREYSYRTAYPEAQTQIVMHEEMPAGIFTVARSADSIRIVDIALLREYRNRGIGTRLIRQVLTDAASLRVSVSLQALAGSPACRLYVRLGFKVVATQLPYMEMEWSP